MCSFRVGAKHFSFDFDGGRASPYHITEKRGRFVGSLWLGLKSLHWLINTWGLLRQTEDLKGFFRFLRTEYSTLELSCLQNQNGRFVELCEYHGGAQHGGIRIPEGYRGKHWDRFVKELHSFFPNKASLAEHHAGKSRTGQGKPNMEKRDPRAGLKPSVSELDILKSRDTRDSSKPSEGSSNVDLPCARLNPNAPCPTRLHEFEWQPLTKTLHITKEVDGKRRAEWVGLRTKAIGLAQEISRAVTQAQTLALANGSANKEHDQEMGDPILEPSPTVNESVEHANDDDSCSSGDEIQAEDFDPPRETSEMAIVCVDPSSPSSVWVDLASMEFDDLIGLYPELSDGVFEIGETSQLLLETASEEIEEPMPTLPITLAEEPIGGFTSSMRAFGDDWLYWAGPWCLCGAVNLG